MKRRHAENDGNNCDSDGGQDVDVNLDNTTSYYYPNEDKLYKLSHFDEKLKG